VAACTHDDAASVREVGGSWHDPGQHPVSQGHPANNSLPRGKTIPGEEQSGMPDSLHRLVHGISERAVELLKRLIPNLQPHSRAELPPGDGLVVFLHIPRTAGDSMRTHLFNVASWDSTPFEVPPELLSPEMLQQLGQQRFIKGFLSLRDLRGLENPRAFTFLRDPVERCLSLYYFLGRGRRPTGRTHTLEEFLHSDDPLLASYSRNAMTWQLGDCLHIGHRRLSEAQALEKAKETLARIEFVGFYEDLSSDFGKLRRKIFPQLRIHPFFPLVFQLGALMSLHRRRVRKYASMVGPAERAAITSANALYIELYAWARARAGRPNAMFDSYSEWFGWLFHHSFRS
jgi:hypothetical protein